MPANQEQKALSDTDIMPCSNLTVSGKAVITPMMDCSSLWQFTQNYYNKMIEIILFRVGAESMLT